MCGSPVDGTEAVDEAVTFGDTGGMFIFASVGLAEEVEAFGDNVIIQIEIGEFELFFVYFLEHGFEDREAGVIMEGMIIGWVNTL